MKIYINSAKENWVVDRFISEWNQYNQKQTKNYYFGKKIIWLIAPWTWKKVPKDSSLKIKSYAQFIILMKINLIGKKWKIFLIEISLLIYIMQFLKIHIINYEKSSKPIVKIPFWVNQNIWFEISSKKSIYEEFKLSPEKYYVGSFQRDTEGHDLISPKLSKGPDQFIEIVKYLNSNKDNLHIILTGKERGYIMDQLDKVNIPYTYFEMISF